MIQELLYTSHEGRGLRQGGGGGFCTVLSTEGMASNLAAALEKLSGYKHPFDIHDPRSRQNPVNYRHAIIRVGGVAYHVLSRIADLKGEHTGRSNKLAHHVVLTQSDLVPGGPTRLLAHPGFSRTSWDGKVELVHAVPRSSVPGDHLPPQVCRHWQSAAGDAGLAGHVADQLLSSPNPAVSVIFPLGADTLALADEIYSLLPPDRRWAITFSTYYAAAPPISSCHLRFVLDETADAELLRRDHRQLVVDLANPPNRLADSPLVAAARSGVRPDGQQDADRIRSAVALSEPRSAPDEADDSMRSPLRDPTPSHADAVTLPALSREVDAPARLQLRSQGPYRLSRRIGTQRKSIRKWLIGAGIVAVGFLLVGALAFALMLKSGSNAGVRAEAKKAPKKSITVQEAVAELAVTRKPREDNKQQGERGKLPSTNGEPDTELTDEEPDQSKVTATPTPWIDDAASKVPAQEEPPVSEGDASPVTNSIADSATTAAVPTEQETSDTIILRRGPRIPLLKQKQQFSRVSAMEAAALDALETTASITDCELIGLEWVDLKWREANGGRTVPLTFKKSQGVVWQVLVPDGFGTSISLATVRFEAGKPVFKWETKAVTKAETSASMAAALNALRWCVLKVTAEGDREYFSLSDPEPPKTCTLFPLGKPTLVVGSALPVGHDGTGNTQLILRAPLDPWKELPRNGRTVLEQTSSGGAHEWDIVLELVLVRSLNGETELATSFEIHCQVFSDIAPLEPGSNNALRTLPRLKETRETFTESQDISTRLKAMETIHKDRSELLATKKSAVTGSGGKQLATLKKQIEFLEADETRLRNRVDAFKILKDRLSQLENDTVTATIEVDLQYNGTDLPLIKILGTAQDLSNQAGPPS